MKRLLSFEDVLITPKFSTIKSRRDVDLSQNILGINIKSPYISSNMDTVTEDAMANAMWENGGLSALHRFMDINKNVEMFKRCPQETIVSIGLGDKELQRAEALYQQGACNFLIDVAHGASMEVVSQFMYLRELFKNNINIIVGNFATAMSIKDFKYHSGTTSRFSSGPNAYKVGIGGGSACLTRIVTGCGLPTFASIQDCATTGEVIIADGGIRNSGDCVKALAAGADLIMMGKMFAGTDESPGEVIYSDETKYVDLGVTKFTKSKLTHPKEFILGKKYRGSASQESYEVQGKTASHRSPEGDSYYVPYVGPVKNVIENLNAGIASACSYTNSENLEQLRKNVEFIEITTNGVIENSAHGKKI